MRHKLKMEQKYVNFPVEALEHLVLWQLNVPQSSCLRLPFLQSLR